MRVLIEFSTPGRAYKALNIIESDRLMKSSPTVIHILRRVQKRASSGGGGEEWEVKSSLHPQNAYMTEVDISKCAIMHRGLRYFRSPSTWWCVSAAGHDANHDVLYSGKWGQRNINKKRGKKEKNASRGNRGPALNSREIQAGDKKKNKKRKKTWFFMEVALAVKTIGYCLLLSLLLLQQTWNLTTRSWGRREEGGRHEIKKNK